MKISVFTEIKDILIYERKKSHLFTLCHQSGI